MSAFTLGDMHTMVRDALGRGTSLNSAIARRVAFAANWIERNYTFQYMRTLRVSDVLASATYPHILSLAGIRLKGIEVIRKRSVDSASTGYLFSDPLKKLRPADRSSRPVGTPTSYWLNGVNQIVFDAIPDEDMTFECNFQEYTIWGTADSWTHWLLDNAQQLLFARSMMIMVSRTRDPDLWNMYKSEFDLELQSFNVGEEELQTGDVVQVWGPPEGTSANEDFRSV